MSAAVAGVLIGVTVPVTVWVTVPPPKLPSITTFEGLPMLAIWASSAVNVNTFFVAILSPCCVSC